MDWGWSEISEQSTIDEIQGVGRKLSMFDKDYGTYNAGETCMVAQICLLRRSILDETIKVDTYLLSKVQKEVL